MDLNKIRNYLSRTYGASRSYIDNARYFSERANNRELGRMNPELAAAIREVATYARTRESGSWIPSAHLVGVPCERVSGIEKIIRRLVK